MRTILSPPQSGPRRLLLAGALSVPLSALLLAGTASAAAPGASPEPGSTGSSSAAREEAPGQQKKDEPAAEAARPAAEQPSAGPKAAGPKAAGPTPAEESKGEPAGKPAPAAGASSSSKGTGSSNGTSGTATAPQPLSTADRNGTGANPGQACTHAYCSTRNGSPSLNGEGGGAAKGKPCAGCVGRADNKNPAGQAPDGSDANAGYECDRNKGIGRSNPAHTACSPVVVVDEVPPVVRSCPPGSPTGATPADNCALPVQRTTPVPPAVTITPDSGVLSGALVRPVTTVGVVPFSAGAPQLVAGPAAQVASASVVRPTALPFTGAELLWLLPTALIALALGTALVGFGRRDAVRV